MDPHPHSMSPLDYITRKGFFSVILQAVMGHQGQFININIGWPEQVHDACVFRNYGFPEGMEWGEFIPSAPTLELAGLFIPS